MESSRRHQPVTAPGRTTLMALVFVALLGLGSCSGDGSSGSSASTTTAEGPHAVGTTTMTFVNESPIVTSAGPEGPRPLVTTLAYPAEGTPGAGSVADAPPDSSAGPYPLIVFAHGLGGSPESVEGLLAAWASAGYVVAAPAFPNTSPTATADIDPGDYANQPGDVSEVITAMITASGTDGEPLSGMVDPSNIGVAGHSLGGITTLGVAANSCCRDERIGAAVVMAGDPLRFPGGEFAYDDAPPLLLVHGTDDDLVDYGASVDVFNDAAAPKGLLTLAGGDHGAPVSEAGSEFATVVAVTTDFFDAYLDDDQAALERLESEAASPESGLVLVTDPASTVTIPTAPDEPDRDLVVTVSPDVGLVDGQTVTVSWRGFTPGKTINIVQCSNRTAGDAAACDLQNGQILKPNPTGEGSLPLVIVVGPVGTGVCDAGTPDCQIVVNDGGSLDPADSVRVSIAFAP